MCVCVYNSLILLQQLYTIYTTYYYYYYSYHIYYYRTADLSWVPEPDRIRSRAGNWILCRARYRFQIVAPLMVVMTHWPDKSRKTQTTTISCHYYPPENHRIVLGKTSTMRDFICGYIILGLQILVHIGGTYNINNTLK